METIILAPTKADNNTKMCSQKGQFCLEIINQDGKNNLVMTIKSAGQADAKTQVPVADDADDGGFDHSRLAVYPKIYLLKDNLNKQIKAALFGTITEQTEMYSGGSADGETLNLYYAAQIGREDDAQLVLDLPLYGYKMIRACFSEAEYKARHYSCHDEYKFDVNFKPAKQFINSMPVFDYSSTAANFPKGVMLDGDSTQIKFRKKDFVWQTDPDCSVKTQFTFDSKSKTYIPQKKLPECGDYFPMN